MARAVTQRYIDPLAQVWLGAARHLGLEIVRSADTYASTDGRGRLTIAIDADLDADDSLAQMIFHEICHSLVEGADSFKAPDWGMDNTAPDHDWREHACLRTQWVLTGRHGLRGLFAPTTEFRAFWDTLSGDVLADRTDPSVQRAIAALRRSDTLPWAGHLAEALAASARIAADARNFAIPFPAPTPLWATINAPRARHPTGLPGGEATGTCGSCAWRFDKRGGSYCRQANAKIDPAWPSCERFEAALDCLTCGACCREAYHSVDVAPRDPMVKKQPSFVVKRGARLEVLRNNERCAALHGGEVVEGKATKYLCVIYDDRPKTCREFTLGSFNCLTARRRVGLSLGS